MKLDEIISRLELAFVNPEAQVAVLHPDWLHKNRETGIHSTGFCYAASEVIYCLTGGNNTWKVRRIPETDWPNEGTHYYLENRHTQEHLDITSDQYTQRGLIIPYHLSKGASFRGISNRARRLAEFAEIKI